SLGLALDARGMAHIVYQAFTGQVNRLMYAIQSGDNFFTETVEEAPGTGYFASVGILPDDFPVISYADESTHSLRYAFFDGKEWYKYTLDTQGSSVGWYSSLAVLGDRVSLAYWTNNGLRFTTLQHNSKTSTAVSGGSSGGGGGCFVATAAFGMMAADSVVRLTASRDDVLLTSGSGSGLLSLYYAVSPTLASSMSRTDAAILRRFVNELVR
ncbi:MAG: CFI-box-CTERM domain-containing protein, partial [Candidatus Brocadiia bacterium]